MEEQIIEYINKITKGVVTISKSNARDIINIVKNSQESSFCIEYCVYSMRTGDYVPKKSVNKNKIVFDEIRATVKQQKEVKELYKYIFKEDNKVVDVFYVSSSDNI